MKPVICANGQIRPADDGTTIDPQYLGLHRAIRAGANAKVEYNSDGTITINGLCCPEGNQGQQGTTAVRISNDADNRLKEGSDGGLYVRDALDPNPLPFYILAKQ